MNQLSIQVRVQILIALSEGVGINAACCTTGASKNTVLKLLADVGAACSQYQSNVMRDSRCTRLEVNEIRTFVGAKLENHMRAVSFYFMVYNCCKIHSSINTTPAMQAGVTTYLWTIEDIVMMSKTVHS